MRSIPRAKGFSLIEVMIVVGILGILAAIALPAYQDYTVRSKVSEGVLFASAAKIAVVESYTHVGEFPSSNEAAGLSDAEDITSQYVDRLEIRDEGRIWVTFNDAVPQLNQRSVVLAAEPQGSALSWCCYSPDIDARYMPASCRDSTRCSANVDPDTTSPPPTDPEPVPEPDPDTDTTDTPPPSYTDQEKTENCTPRSDNAATCERQDDEIPCPSTYPNAAGNSNNCRR